VHAPSRPGSGALRRLTGRASGLDRAELSTLLRQGRVALTPRTSLLKARLANGAIVYGQNRAGFGGRGVYIYRDSAEPEFEHLERFLDESGVFIDVGANTGKYALKAAKHYAGTGVVLAIEPFPHVLATLGRSVQANGFGNVRLRNFCIGDRTAETVFWMNRGKPHDFSLVQIDDTAASFSVMMVSIDELFRWEGLDRLDYLKVDAVGSERSVLDGARRTIEQYRPIINVQATRPEVADGLPQYSGYRAPNGSAVLFIPDEHPKSDVPNRLGWHRLRDAPIVARAL
jgi:FkbM family methyltransferase